MPWCGCKGAKHNAAKGSHAETSASQRPRRTFIALPEPHSADCLSWHTLGARIGSPMSAASRYSSPRRAEALAAIMAVSYAFSNLFGP